MSYNLYYFLPREWIKDLILAFGDTGIEAVDHFPRVTLFLATELISVISHCQCMMDFISLIRMDILMLWFQVQFSNM